MSNTKTQVTLLTPYRCSVLVNSLLNEKGVDKVLPPQMFYTYVKKGFIPSTEGKVTLDDLTVWFEKYYTKNFS